MKVLSPAHVWLGFSGSGWSSRRFRRGFVGTAVAGPGHVGLGLDGFEAAFQHDPADSGGGADNALVGKLSAYPPVAIAAAVALEYPLDFQAGCRGRFVGGCSRSSRVIRLGCGAEDDCGFF